MRPNEVVLVKGVMDVREGDVVGLRRVQFHLTHRHAGTVKTVGEREEGRGLDRVVGHREIVCPQGFVRLKKQSGNHQSPNELP